MKTCPCIPLANCVGVICLLLTDWFFGSVTSFHSKILVGSVQTRSKWKEVVNLFVVQCFFEIIIMPGKCRFQDIWTRDQKYRECLMRGKLIRMAKCRFCEKALNVSNMGEAALKSHMKGITHQAHAKEHQEQKSKSQTQISDFVQTAKSAESASKVTRPASAATPTIETRPQTTDTRHAPTGSGTPGFNTFITTEDTLKAEILWTLKMVTSHSHSPAPEAWKSCSVACSPIVPSPQSFLEWKQSPVLDIIWSGAIFFRHAEGKGPVFWLSGAALWWVTECRTSEETAGYPCPIVEQWIGKWYCLSLQFSVWLGVFVLFWKSVLIV